MTHTMDIRTVNPWQLLPINSTYGVVKPLFLSHLYNDMEYEVWFVDVRTVKVKYNS